MPNRRKRAQLRRGGVNTLLIALIMIFAVLAGGLIFLLLNSPSRTPVAGDASARLASTDVGPTETGATHVPLVLGATSPPEATPEPTRAGDILSVSAEPVSTAQANRYMPEPAEGDYFLPVIDRALRTADDRAMIAVTLDDCDNSVKMTRALNIAARYDAKLTLFPTGDALMKLGSGFRTCVNTLGFELENITYDPDKKDYELSTGELALQIWRQSLAASYAMGRDYQQHFYRPSMPESAGDQRTHYFIRKLGFTGVVTCTHSYKGQELSELTATLANGNIYQFDMSDESMALLEPFISEANRKGYKLVTLNELMGLSANAQGRALTISQQTLPATDDYAPTYYDLKLNDRTNAVYTLQARLMGLGYMSVEAGQSLVADGIYGSATSAAVSKFQAGVGMIATGNADVATQQRLFSADAPVATQ